MELALLRHYRGSSAAVSFQAFRLQDEIPGQNSSVRYYISAVEISRAAERDCLHRFLQSVGMVRDRVDILRLARVARKSSRSLALHSVDLERKSKQKMTTVRLA